MNSSRLITIAALVLGGSFAAQANDVDPHGFEQQRFESSRTRAEVQAEGIAAARADWLSGFNAELGYIPFAAAQPAGMPALKPTPRQPMPAAASNGGVPLQPFGAV